MKHPQLRSTAFCIACSVVVGCSTAPTIGPAESFDYGTAGIGPISAEQRRALFNCYAAGDSATKIVELRSEGKSDEAIIQHYAATVDKGWLRLIYDLLPIVAKDNPPAPSRIDYGRSVYRRCLRELFEPPAIQIAEYCFQQNQFVLLAFSFRDGNEPMEMAYTKMPARGKAKMITDALLVRAREIGKGQETNFRINTYYGCLGHPDKSPVDRK